MSCQSVRKASDMNGNERRNPKRANKLGLFVKYSSMSSSSSSSSLYSSFTPDMDTDQHLPTYNPLSHVVQRDLSRLRLAQKAVHLIPLLVLLCAIILWFFSSPTNKDYRI